MWELVLVPGIHSGLIVSLRTESSGWSKRKKEGEEPRAQGFALPWSVHQLCEHLARKGPGTAGRNAGPPSWRMASSEPLRQVHGSHQSGINAVVWQLS